MRTAYSTFAASMAAANDLIDEMLDRGLNFGALGNFVVVMPNDALTNDDRLRLYRLRSQVATVLVIRAAMRR